MQAKSMHWNLIPSSVSGGYWGAILRTKSFAYKCVDVYYRRHGASCLIFLVLSLVPSSTLDLLGIRISNPPPSPTMRNKFWLLVNYLVELCHTATVFLQ